MTTSECPRWRLTEPHYINIPTLPDGTRVVTTGTGPTAVIVYYGIY